MKFKKVLNCTLALAITLTQLPILNSNSVKASELLEKETCVQTNTGRQCKIEQYMKMSTYFTNAEAKDIVKKYESWSEKLLLQYIIGLHPAGAFGTLAINIGYKNLIGYFQSAVNKGTGVKITYDYVLNPNSHSLNRVENGKVSYE